MACSAFAIHLCLSYQFSLEGVKPYTLGSYYSSILCFFIYTKLLTAITYLVHTSIKCIQMHIFKCMIHLFNFFCTFLHYILLLTLRQCSFLRDQKTAKQFNENWIIDKYENCKVGLFFFPLDLNTRYNKHNRTVI